MTQMPPATPEFAATVFAAACRAELAALKPGNVHIHSAGHGMEVAHFERAAAAAARHIAQPELRVGERILASVEASLAVAGCNTNLGIVLLSAPLVAAALRPGPSSLRQRLSEVLAELDRKDAEAAFRAIALANPGGLGASAEADVRAPAQVDLKAAMALAAGRDRIAAQYVTDFADVFTIGVPALDEDPCASRGVENAYLALLSAFPDSHIARKFGAETAETVRREAALVKAEVLEAGPAARHAALAAFDQSLKGRGLNPGTTADLTVASILAALLRRG